MRQLLPVAGETDPTRESDVDLVAAYEVRGAAPHVRANFVSSLDGAVTIDGRSAPLSSPGDHEIFRVLRGLADVILVGSGTVRTEGYGAVQLDPVTIERRRRAGQDPVPRLAVITGSLDLPPELKLFNPSGPLPILLTSGAAPVARRRAIADRAEVLVAGGEHVVLGEAISQLAERGLAHVLCEGGPSVLGQLVAQDLLDELCLTLSPMLTGGPPPGLLGGVAPDQPKQWAPVGLLEEAGWLFLRLARHG